MPRAFAQPPVRRRRASVKLLMLTLGVGWVHALLLGALPVLPSPLPLHAATPQSHAAAAPWVVRTLSAPPAPPAPLAARASPQPRPGPALTAGPAPARAVPRTANQAAALPASTLLAPAPPTTSPPAVLADPSAAGPALNAQPPSEPDLAAPPASAAEAVAAAAAPPGLQLAALSDAPEAAPKPRPPATDTPPAPAAPTTPTARTQRAPLLYPPAARLIYDGKGEEKGFLKYNAGGELLWRPEGIRYSAKLEITFLTARLRTWTSKGDLTDAGLQPLRFGDKPRGAELATHFQRDKGIISFSANNPEVPLQPGAQDKLSILIQLGALVAGAPARYGAGSSIGIQAADAHRAEWWTFKVGAMEALELPGGAVRALKLSKEPTLEFDQRIEVWLASEQHYLPVRLRITEASNAFVDLLWQKTLKPE